MFSEDKIMKVLNNVLYTNGHLITNLKALKSDNYFL